MLAIRLSEEIEARLTDLAVKTGRTKTYYARQAILEYLDDMEDLYLAEQRYAAVKTGQNKIYTLEEVEKSLGLGD